jgi:hypothetical protein
MFVGAVTPANTNFDKSEVADQAHEIAKGERASRISQQVLIKFVGLGHGCPLLSSLPLI